MGAQMKQLIDRFQKMQKIAAETLSAEPGALVGVDSLPGSEHDAKVPEEAKKPDAEVAQGQPAGATSVEGAVVGGDAKPLNEGKLELDEPLLNPEQKPLITDDALTAKTANARLLGLVNDLLKDLNGTQKQAEQKKPVQVKTEPAQKQAAPAQKITLDDETISKLAAAQATFMLGHQAAENMRKQASAQTAKADLSCDSARKLIKAACVKAAQEQGLDPAMAAAAADNAMAAAGMPAAEAGAAAPADAAAADAAAADAAAAEAAAADAAPADAAGAIPEDVTEEELATAIVDLVSSGELDPATAKALVEEIAAEDGGAAPSEDQAAEIIAQGIESGEITPEQAEEIAAAIESGDAGADGAAADAAADAAVANPEAQGAADAAAAVQDAQDEAQGAADAEEAMKAAAAQIRSNTLSKVASAVVKNRQAVQQKEAAAKSTKCGSRIMDKVASIMQSKKAKCESGTKCASTNDEAYIAGFKKKAAEMGVDPSALAKYVLDRQAK